MKRLLDREEALLTTLKDHKKISYTFPINKQTAEFLEANNINSNIFNNMHSLLIQHLITKEITITLQSSVAAIHTNEQKPCIANFFKHNAQLAIAAQQYNQQNQIELALTLTDCCHFFSLYGSSIFDDTYNDNTQKVNLTEHLGKTLYKYVAFAERLYNAPKIVLDELASNLNTIADCLDDIAEEINQSKNLHRLIHHDQQEGLLGSLYHCKTMISNIQKKSPETTEDVQPIRELRMKSALLFLCTSTSHHLHDAGSSIQTTIPANFRNSPIGFGKTNTDEIITFLESTNELLTISSAVNAELPD